MSAHPNSQANLDRNRAAAWQPGQSGNSRGRPAAGASFLEWLNELADVDGDEAKYDEDALEAIRDDKKAPTMKRGAARLILLGNEGGFHPQSGKPYCLQLFEFFMDRTIGKPTQRVEVEHKPALMPADADARMMDLLDRTPGMADNLRQLLAEHDRRRTIDTTATPTVGRLGAVRSQNQATIGSADRQ